MLLHTNEIMKKFVAIFPGQGSQFVGMNKSIYDEYKIVRDTVQEAEDVTGINLKDICFNGPLSVLSKPCLLYTSPSPRD